MIQTKMQNTDKSLKKKNTVEKYVVQYKCKVVKLNRPRAWSHIGAESNATT